MFNKILIANRGEIAVRIARTCRRLGVATVAVYSEADAGAFHVRAADEAIPIGPPAPAQSYLRGERLIAAALETSAEAIHPGFGFLSENAAFARAVRAAGLVFIGPPAEAIEAMGSKTAARARMEAAGVPIVPGFQSADDAEPAGGWVREAERIGFPVLVKAAAGGGGKGMRVVHAPDALAEAIASAQREAGSAFGDPTIFLERYLTDPRHVEFQVFGDAHGNVVHLFERDCSVQRRHQKIIEESPSPVLTPELRAQMGAAAVAAARAVGYQNAGTVEFIVDGVGNFFFLEMNTRIQVEHPVTEMVTGLDLVEWQLRVAAGEPLPLLQAALAQRGHAIECRLYAEDPAHDFLPATGPVLLADFPNSVRVDAGVETGDEVTIHYDPMIAKLIVHAPSRAEAIRRMLAALRGTTLLGLRTNLAFLQAILDHPAFRAGDVTTHFIPQHLEGWQPSSSTLPDDALIALAFSDLLADRAVPAPSSGDPHSPWAVGDGFRVGV